MCGLVFAYDRTGAPVNNAILDQYDKQKTRGQEGFGVFDGQFGHMIRSAHEDGILKWLTKYNSNLLLMHHRLPTSTINVKRAAHPFSTKDYFGKTQYVLVHNGGIRNATELFCDHQEMGIDYYSLLQDLTFNDSEALLWDFALTMEGRQAELKAEGGIAFICLKLVKGKLERMYFGKNYSKPLNMVRTKQSLSLSSEGEGEPIKDNTLYNYNYKSNRLTTKSFTIPTYFATPVTPKYQPNYSGTSLLDCNCRSVGWQECNYHGEDDDYGWGDNLSRQVQATQENRASQAVGNILQRQFGDKFGFPETPVIPRKHIEYEQDPKTQLMLPVGEIRRQKEDRKLKRMRPITDEEINSEYVAYLAGVKGVFEHAYWNLEADYEQIEKLVRSKKNIRKRRVIELVMERLEHDPEYTSEHSVSKIWEKI